MEIKYVKYGIANNFGDYVELNEHLKEYPELHDAVLKHELAHTKHKFSFKDLFIDFSDKHVDNFRLMKLKFMIKHPGSLTQLSPFLYKKDTLFFDVNCFIFWLIMASAIGISIFLAI